MSQPNKRNKIRKSHELNKDEYVKFNITLDKTALQNYEKLKEKLAYKSLSNTVRQLLQFAMDNIELLKTVNIPGGQTNDNVQAIIKQIMELRPQEIEKQESRFLKIETAQDEILNKLNKLLNIEEIKDKEVFDKAKSKVNGLGGKI